MPATTSHRAATGRLIASSRTPLWFTVTTGRVGRLATMIALLLAAALLAGCSGTVTIGGSDTVDPTRMSASIARLLKEQFPDVRVGGIACPRGVKLTAGTTFQCTADMEVPSYPSR